MNKQKYQNPNNVEIRLSAFVVELSEADKNTGNISGQANRLWANNAYNSPSYFSFEGTILGIKETNVDRSSIGCVMAIKLGNGERTGGDMVIDCYVTSSNINAKKIQKGLPVTGVLWFQGEIAD